ncbi:succinyl-diaminopimelate desuccinylase [Helicobacter ibis]|uniref:Succinyl-diaminopimelate desuccinylase n=1 Tax=Helicobacter ibis TaxID=2962633 RepID=A0ABT4VDY8_9HELI|nr:succinyl-diaminopimelate desuccinylase [Helicobacter ibis]MDA3968894.1 succinyl-diaminopimelate desuccinylase [Helicobacter ibis]
MVEIEILKKLISFKSVTPNESGSYEYILGLLSGFKALEFDKNGVKNLFLYKQYGECKDSLHICFAGHVDVVPAGDSWDSDPFTPIIKDGYIYGRGTQDMKSGIAAFLSAIMEIESFNGIISILLTSDEEGEAIYGTKYALEELEKMNLLPNFAIVAEPTSVESVCDMIKIGRRGSINGILTLEGKQGHVAYPSKCINPTEILAVLLPKIAGYNLDNGDDNFEPSKIVITDIRGGMEAVNVTPQNIKIMFNIRNSTNTTLKDVEEYFYNLLKDTKHTLTLKQSSKPFLSKKDSLVVSLLVKSIQNVLNINPALSTSGGTSDARYFAEYGISVVECGVCNDRIHAVNERVKISELESLRRVFSEFINLAKGIN